MRFKTRRESASEHARRSWTCTCGRVVFGNGGKSSHQRACLVWAQSRLEAGERLLAEISAGTWGKGMRPALVEQFRHQYTLDVERLRARLAQKDGGR